MKALAELVDQHEVTASCCGFCTTCGARHATTAVLRHATMCGARHAAGRPSGSGGAEPLHQSWHASAMTVVFESVEIEYTDACIVL